MRKVALAVVCLVLAAVTAYADGRESVLDRKVYVEKTLALGVPEVPPLCDGIKGLKKSKIDVGNCKLYCEQEGNGTPIVLIAGGPGCTHHLFHPDFSEAAKHARIIYYDQRGVGQSDQDPTGKAYTIEQAVRDLDDLRKALKIEKWIVLGHSYGGFLAQCYALEYPQHVLGLVLVCASPGTPKIPVDKTRQHDYMTEEEITKVRSIFADGNLSEEQKLYSAHLNGDWKRQDFYKPTSNELARMARYEWKPAPEFRNRIGLDMNQIDLEGKFANFDIPALIIEGKWDLTWNTDKPAKMQKNHPRAEMVVFERSGHSPFGDEPDRFFSVLDDFAKSAKAAPTPAAGRTGTRISWPTPVLGDIIAMGLGGTAEQAAALLVEAEKADMTNPTGWLLLGLNLYSGRDYEKSLIAFRRAEAVTDANGEPWEVFAAAALKGLVLDLLSRRDDALGSYKKALDSHRKADGKPGAEYYSVEIDECGLLIDPKWVEERLKTPFERK